MCPSRKSSNRSSTRLETWRQKIIKYEWNFSVKISFIIFICFQTISTHSERPLIFIYIHNIYEILSRRCKREQQNKTHQMNDEHVNLQGLYNMGHHWCLRIHEVMCSSGIKNFKIFFVQISNFLTRVRKFFTFANFQCFF